MTKIEGLAMMIHGYFIANEKTVVSTEELTREFRKDEITATNVGSAITKLVKEDKVKQIAIYDEETEKHRYFVVLANQNSYYIEM